MRVSVDVIPTSRYARAGPPLLAGADLRFPPDRRRRDLRDQRHAQARRLVQVARARLAGPVGRREMGGAVGPPGGTAQRVAAILHDCQPALVSRLARFHGPEGRGRRERVCPEGGHAACRAEGASVAASAQLRRRAWSSAGCAVRAKAGWRQPSQGWSIVTRSRPWGCGCPAATLATSGVYKHRCRSIGSDRLSGAWKLWTSS
jgi:hypothetical protein